MVGRTLAHYEIIGKLGAGGMGEVYLARDTTLDRLVALKVLPAEVSGDADRLHRLQREAKALAALDHPNIVTIFSVEESEGIRFLTMAHIDGRTLQEAIPSGGLAVERLLSFSISLADALRAAHEHGIVHRDLKPGNVMIDAEDRLRVLDFGLAKVQPVTAMADASGVATQTMTRQGTILGTVPYMSPEQVEGKPVDARSDLFSLGIMLYEMATGRRPFRGETPASLISSILRDTPIPVTEVQAGLPERLSEIINRCLQKDPLLRFECAEQLRAELQQLQSEMTSDRITASSPPAKAAVPAGFPSRTLAAMGLLAVLAAIAVSAWKLRPWSDQPPTAASKPRVSSIVVFPLDNLSGDGEQDYFVDGMTAALIADLSRINLLKVIAPSAAKRFTGNGDSLPEIARRLNAEAVLDGSVLRQDDRVAVTLQLRQARSAEILWARRYERDVTSVLALHGEMARTIAQEIEIELTADERAQLSAERTVDRETYEAYLRGMHHLSKGTSEGFATGIAFLNDAIEHDPGNPLAYAGLALGYIRIGHDTGPSNVAFPRAIAAAKTALRLDPNLAEAHAVIADAKMYYEWDFEGSKADFEGAVQLNPSLAEAHAHYAWYYAIYARWEEAIKEARLAQELDPLSAVYTSWVGALLWYAGDYEAAIVEVRKSLDLDPDHAFSWYILGGVFASQDRFDEAIEAHRKASTINPSFTWVLAGSYGSAGRTEEGRRILDDWSSSDQPAPALNVAMALGTMGETDQALAKLEIAYEQRHPWMPWINVLPELRSLKGDPRFKELLQKMNIDDRTDTPTKANVQAQVRPHAHRFTRRIESQTRRNATLRSMRRCATFVPAIPCPS